MTIVTICIDDDAKCLTISLVRHFAFKVRMGWSSKTGIELSNRFSATTDAGSSIVMRGRYGRVLKARSPCRHG